MEKRQELNEGVFLQRACAGEPAAFQSLIEEYHYLVWRTVCILIPERAAVEDAVQEIWIDVWRGLPGFQPTRAFRPWLLTVVTNRCRKTTRRVLPCIQPLETIESEQIIAPDDLLQQWLQQETAQEIRDLLQTLPPEQRQVLQFRYFADLELAEIAQVMETSIGTVKSRLHRALSRLRLQLQTPHLTKGR